MNTQITSAAPSIISALTAGEVTTTLETACKQYAQFAERGCKYIGLLRGQLVSTGLEPADVFGIVVASLEKGGMDLKRAKSTANNGKGHSEMAEFALKDGLSLKETHFYGIGVSDSRRVTTFLRKGGDEAITAINKIKPDKSGKITSRMLDKLIPPTATVEDGEGEGEGEGEGGGSDKSAFDRALILLTSIQSLMKEMTEDEANALRESAMEFIIG